MNWLRAVRKSDSRNLGFNNPPLYFKAVVSVGLLFAFFYIVVVSWSVWYLAASIGFRLEWAYCGHDYNTDDCYEIATNTSVSTGATVGKSSVEQYWERYVLGSDGRDWDNFVSFVLCHKATIVDVSC